MEYLLGALGGDLISGFASHAGRSGGEVDAMEASVSGWRDNPLVYLGVGGERSHPGFEEILDQIWQTTWHVLPS